MILQDRFDLISDFLTVLEYWDSIFSGFLLTMWLYAWAILIGFFLGLFFSIIRQYGGRILSWFSTGYIEIIRGTPLLAQLFFFYYLPTYTLGISWKWRFEVNFNLFDKDISFILLDYRTFIAILTLGLNSSAYQAEYFRGAFMSIGTGQLMAAQSLGMSRTASIRHIVLPQALRRVIPAWSNEAAYLPKYTVVVSYIAVEELFAQVDNIYSFTFITLPSYLIIAIIFIVVITIISKILDIVHNRTKIPGL